MSYTTLPLVGSIVTFVATSTFLSTAYYPQLWTFYVFAKTLLWLQRDLDRRQADQAEMDSVGASPTIPGASKSRNFGND